MTKTEKNDMKKLLGIVICVMMSLPLVAEDHVMAATRGASQNPAEAAPKALSLSLKEAQDYAVQQNRSLRNASLAVQQAYAQRWQTIAAMLPQLDGSYTYNNYCGYSATMSMGGASIDINMPNVGALGLTASMGLNGQAIVGVLLNNIAIDMQRLNYEIGEDELRANIKLSYASVLVLEDIVSLMDSSLINLQRVAEMTQRSVDVGAAEQTSADQIQVRVNTIKDNINSQKRNVSLALASLKVLLDVPAETEISLTTRLEELLTSDAVMQLLGEEYLKERNLNYQLLQKNVELAEKNVHMAGWAYGPTVSLAYNYTNQQYYGEGGMRMTPPHLVQLSLRMPLWSSGKRAAGVVDKKIALEAARNTLAETTDNLDIQYQQLRYELQNAYESYLTQKTNLDVTRRVFESTTNKFNYGRNSNLELVNASNDVITAQSTYVQAVLTLVQANVELEKFLNN